MINEKFNDRFALSPRQIEVASMAHRGLTNPEIAQRLYVTENCIKFHMSHVFKKCGVKSRVELATLIDKICNKV